MRYYVHLSDTHFGARGVEAAETELKSLLEAQLATMDPNAKLRFIVTGDGVDSPSKKNNKAYVDFSSYLEEKCGREPMFVLGNHDINAVGLAFWRDNQILANFVGQYPKIKRARDMDVIFLLLNSNTDGRLAQGEVGKEQMEKAATLLSAIDDLEKCTLVAVLHHHVAPVPEELMTTPPWWKRFIPKRFAALFPSAFIEETVRLRDADEFVRFLRSHDVRFVLHGHKHIPFVTEHKGINIIACGSSTKAQADKDASHRCFSYNVLTFDEATLTCDQYAEYAPGSGIEKTASVTFEL